MKLIPHTFPIPFLEFQNFYNIEELLLIWDELEYLKPELRSPKESRGAYDDNGVQLKLNRSVFLDNIYPNNRQSSKILSLSPKFYTEEINDELIKLHPFYGLYSSCNWDHTLISYYEEGNYYKRHKDISVLTSTIFLYKEPKSFEGGEFVFSDFNYKIEIKNNCGLIMPSCIYHHVNTIRGEGRFSITNFASINPNVQNVQ